MAEQTVVDAQVHIWPADTPERPWPDFGRSYAHGPELTADEMLARMDAAGVDRAVLVPWITRRGIARWLGWEI